MNSFIFSLLLLAGLLTITRHPVLRGACRPFSCCDHSCGLAARCRDTGVGFWDALLSALGLGALTVVVLWAVLREGPVTAHRIRGAIAAYLLLAVFFAYVYGLIEYVYPGSLRFPEGMAGGKGELHQGFLYFSVVTITTLGYGDITPIHPWARSAVMLEAIIGPLYLAILVARLVSLRMDKSK